MLANLGVSANSWTHISKLAAKRETRRRSASGLGLPALRLAFAF